MEVKKVIEKANLNLKSYFGDRAKPISEKEVKEVYDRTLLSINVDAKTSKGQKLQVLTGVLYLAPTTLSGVNLCPKASNGCKKSCLFTAGRGVMLPVYRARVLRSLAFLLDQARFEASLKRDIKKLVKKAKKLNQIPAIRLNGTSDLAFESIMPSLFQTFKDIQFYDYTKRLTRLEKSNRPKNLDLTFSLSETNEVEAKKALDLGFRVAVVFDEIPKTFNGVEVINGDETDARFLDKNGVIVGLKAKGQAKKDQSGFVVKTLNNVLETKIAA